MPSGRTYWRQDPPWAILPGMAILKIARMGHPVLNRRADPVADPTAPEIRSLVNDMLETLADVGGIGLAAPQVHVPKRVVIFEVPAARAARDSANGEAADGVPMTVLINPVIEPLADSKAEGWEACLSVPGLTGQVPRYTHIRYSGHDLLGRRIEREARDFHARVVQHECDHLDGVLYPMRMSDLSKLSFMEEMRYRAAAGQAAPSEEELAELAEG
jgi:peptide deformylase